MIKHPVAHITAVAGIAVACLIAAVASAAVPATPAAGTIDTIAGGGSLSADGVPATDAALTFMLGIAVNGDGDVFVSDAANCAVRKISQGVITRVVGTGSCPQSHTSNDIGDGGPALEAVLDRPEGLAFDSARNLYIADSFDCEIRKVDMQTGIITAFAGKGPWHCGAAGDGGPATAATVMNPGGLAIDQYDNVYFSEWQECRVRKVSGGIIDTVAGRTEWCGFSGDGGPATDAVLQGPLGLAVSADDVLYIGDDCRIRAVSAGIITTVAGNGICIGTPDGAAMSTGIDGPYGLAVDGAGALLIADADDCVIRRLESGMITTVAGAPLVVNDSFTPVCGHTGDGGPATSAEIGQPIGVAVDGAANAYIAEIHLSDPGPASVRVIYGVAPPPPSPTPTPTVDPTIDTDDDGCTDVKEAQLVPPTDPNDAWDFYSVPVPALFVSPNPLVAIRDGVVGASDAQAVFAYFKRTAQTGSPEYEQDLDANGIKDGLEYDRSFAGSGHSGPPDGVIGAADAQLAFAQFKLGYRC